MLFVEAGPVGTKCVMVGGAEQDWTGINWLRKLYPVEEGHGGDTGGSFSALGWEQVGFIILPFTVYFPTTLDISLLKSLIHV